MRRPHRVATVAATAAILASATLAGCGEEESPAASEASDSPAASATPAVCSSIDDLKASVAELEKIDVARGALPTLEGGLIQVRDDLATVLDDAQSEYATEGEAVQAAAKTLGASLEAAAATPSERTLTTVRTAVQTFATALKALDNAVRSTC